MTTKEFSVKDISRHLASTLILAENDDIDGVHYAIGHRVKNNTIYLYLGDQIFRIQIDKMEMEA